VFHIPPWDLDRLTAAQLEGMCRVIDQMNKRG
jgi:hypothetical protein